MPKKIIVLIFDGVSLRNFLYTRFPEELKNNGWELIYWNATNFGIERIGEKEIKLNPEPLALTDLLKRAKIKAELNYFKKRFDDSIYNRYKFPTSNKGFKNKIKNGIVSFLEKISKGQTGLKTLSQMMESSERKSSYYKSCRKILEQEQPDLLFCPNQRPINAVAPVTAARDLQIPTACFIFSWDNLPKGTKVVDSDYYFVWSEHMKNELIKYYPNINEEQVKITGSPQFEIHQDDATLERKEVFCKKHDLELDKKYLCFSGDDITTSPHDELFLKDVAESVRKLNTKGENIGVIFRRCPVDFSDRYDKIISEYSNEIVTIEPLWNQTKIGWNEVLPEKEDLILQTNIIYHSFMVINVGSSMVFDFAVRGKPCAYLNYRPSENIIKDIREVYNYVHFRSMPTYDSVYWINKSDEISKIILACMEKDDPEIILNAIKWFRIINNPYGTPTKMMVKECSNIIK